MESLRKRTHFSNLATQDLCRQNITLTQSELDARVAAVVAVAMAASSPYTSGKLSGAEGSQVTAPPLAPDFMYDALSGVPSDRRKTKHMSQATPLSKKKSAEAAAAFRGEEDAAAAGRRPPPRSTKIVGRRGTRSRRRRFRRGKAQEQRRRFGEKKTQL